MNQLNFSSNPHGKLFLEFFQDCRLQDEEKYLIGNVFEIVLRGKLLGVAKIVALRPFVYGKIADTFSFMNCSKHAAYQAAVLNKFYQHECVLQPDTRLVQIVFQYTERNIEVQQGLLQEWWKKVLDQQPFINSNNNQLFDNA